MMHTLSPTAHLSIDREWIR